ncbi:anti-sigma F factor [Proteinivorax hydrogeniformans]|uniref:Anti-sigma F factor n=1 Tax=Proteinivorax hydrogeniformans TaxID=1826727 RepID=A0AAU8HX96_9FIRM
MELKIPSLSKNESFARVTIASFASQLDPTVEEINDIKTAVSEAVTNAIIHGYESEMGELFLSAKIEGDVVEIKVKDAGRGIDDIEQAREPLYTSKPELERSGMGFTIIENFMDEVEILSKSGSGTQITMRKKIVPSPNQN